MKSWISLSILSLLSISNLSGERLLQNLSGNWEITQSQEDSRPADYHSHVPVPGLVDLADPEFQEIGVESDLRQYFYYRTRFRTLDDKANQVELSILKAKYGIRVWLNGKSIGEHLYNFTAARFEVSRALNPIGETNELVIRVGAHPSQLPKHVVWGHDFEKAKYIPGIYDEVILTYSGAPFIDNVQVAPDLEQQAIQVEVQLSEKGLSTGLLEGHYRILEDRSNKLIQSGKWKSTEPKFQFTAKIPNPTLWSPDHPFLYRLEVNTEGDHTSTRFGMRSFHFDPESGFAVLNGKRIFLRGTNICFHRFLEDEQRGVLPWDEDWTRSLFERMKAMEWNSFRNCLGFPPEFWYDLMDEMGFLVQDEYPIWYGGKAETFPETFKAESLAAEYEAWMRERWNRPSIVIWDAQNESVTPETGKAIRMVRSLDLSNRPWDNGYSAPDRPSDPVESHPYVLQNYLGKSPPSQGPLFPYLSLPRYPDNGPSELDPREDGLLYPNPIQNNENVFLWITREGEPTYLTQYIFENILPGDHSPDTIYRFYAYYFNRLITYWRAKRQCATVQEFCTLGYSRPKTDKTSFTSDHWQDVASLTYKPYFQDYAYAAFCPVGLLLDRWETWHAPSTRITVPILMINDLEMAWADSVKLSVRSIDTGQVHREQTWKLSIDSWGETRKDWTFLAPTETGSYILEATYPYRQQQITQTYEFEVREDSADTPDAETSFQDNDQFLHEEDSDELAPDK